MVRLATLKMAPRVAYDVLKFSRRFDAEFEIIEKQRVALIMEISGAGKGEDVTIEQNSPEFDRFVAAFDEVLSVDSDMAVCPMRMPALIAALDASEGNTLAMQDIAMLEVLFESDAEEEINEEVTG